MYERGALSEFRRWFGPALALALCLGQRQDHPVWAAELVPDTRSNFPAAPPFPDPVWERAAGGPFLVASARRRLGN
eukprot:3076602-Pyramimonas_sp.AAC.1